MNKLNFSIFMYTAQLLPELQLRWEKMQTAIQAAGADALLISTNVNLYYASGRIFMGYIYLPASGAPYFFVKRPIGLNGERVVYIRKPEQIAEYLTEHGIAMPKTLFLETDSVSYNEYIRLTHIFSPEQVLNGTALIRTARTTKTDYELNLIRKSGQQHAALYRRVPSVYQEGMTDLEFSIEIEREARLLGSLGIFRVFGHTMEIFMGSVISGENADTPSPYDFGLGGEGLDPSLPVGCNGSIIKPGMTVLVDMGGNFTGYMTDMSRTYSRGNIGDLAVKAHQTALEIQEAVIAAALPGAAAADLYCIGTEIAAKAGLEAYFMGHHQQAGFIGHGVGIEINEAPVIAPRSKDILKPGMVFALEPKFVIPHVGAVGVENTFIVTESGCEKVTPGKEDIISLT